MKTYKLDLLSVPNQSFNTTLNGQNIKIELRTSKGICYMSVLQDSEYLAAGIKCVPNIGILPSPIKNLINGDLKFRCRTDDYPSYDKFSTNDCQLIYEANE